MRNPFVWNRPADAPDQMIEHTDLAAQMASAIRSDHHFALLGAREIGKTSFISTLSRELSNASRPTDVYETLAINLKRAISMSALISCIREALEEHPNSELFRLGRQSISAVEKEFNVDLKVLGFRQKSAIDTHSSRRGDFEQSLKKLASSRLPLSDRF